MNRGLWSGLAAVGLAYVPAAQASAGVYLAPGSASSFKLPSVSNWNPVQINTYDTMPFVAPGPTFGDGSGYLSGTGAVSVNDGYLVTAAPNIISLYVSTTFNQLLINYDCRLSLSAVCNNSSPPTLTLALSSALFDAGTSTYNFRLTISDFTGNGLNIFGIGGSSNPRINVDNVIFAVEAVPEPSTWAMMIIGFYVAGVAVRRGYRRPRLRGVA